MRGKRRGGREGRREERGRETQREEEEGGCKYTYTLPLSTRTLTHARLHTLHTTHHHRLLCRSESLLQLLCSS